MLGTEATPLSSTLESSLFFLSWCLDHASVAPSCFFAKSISFVLSFSYFVLYVCLPALVVINPHYNGMDESTFKGTTTISQIPSRPSSCCLFAINLHFARLRGRGGIWEVLVPPKAEDICGICSESCRLSTRYAYSTFSECSVPRHLAWTWSAWSIRWQTSALFSPPPRPPFNPGHCVKAGIRTQERGRLFERKAAHSASNDGI
jgi:hypothetical protein